ncbi:hypothetical protein [Meiothermus taiwanensis]|uniref:hypothetical protein n=1 Tax=Meiothermus taiwanensis TaxID=172827 RepID=UPI001FE1E1D9|nr:hypothetical protein [Meiothermus taiwanensis]
MNFLQRMPQGAKVALVAALLVAAVAAWYISFFRPNQAAQQPATPTPAPAPEPSAPLTTARPLEVLPVPFLVTEAPRTEQPQEQDQRPAAAATTQPRVTVPPNPFVPLIIETAPTAVAQPNPPAPALASRPVSAPVTPQPIPSQTTQIQVRQPTTPLPRPSLPGTRPTPSAVAPSTPSTQPRLAQGTTRANLPPTINLESTNHLTQIRHCSYV